MTLGKCATGFWIIVLPMSKKLVKKDKNNKIRTKRKFRKDLQSHSNELQTEPAGLDISKLNPENDNVANFPHHDASISPAIRSDFAESEPQLTIRRKNIYPALLLGMAMTTRGEIGFLIAAVAQTGGILYPQELYLVVVWGITLCTLFGPIGVGLVARKIERMEGTPGGRTQVLGEWGEAEKSRNT